MKNSPTSADNEYGWGWQQPAHGPEALALFIDDLHRVLQAHAARQLTGIAPLATAQEQVDTLLAHYVEQRRAPTIFEEQSVTLKEGTDRNGVSHIVPIFSTRLKQALVTMLGQPNSKTH